MCRQVRHGENEAAHDQVESRIGPQIAKHTSVPEQWYHDKVHQGRHRKGDPGCAQQEIAANSFLAHGVSESPWR
jgi:hypothetical protein